MLQVNAIAPMFDMDQSRALWLVQKPGNVAVWPRGGLFSGPRISAGMTYEVKGQPLQRQAQLPLPSSPFGAYMPTPHHTHGMTAPHPPLKRKKVWSKTVILVSLKKKEGVKGGTTKGNSRVQYEIVTQVTVTLDSSSPCSVPRVAELVAKQTNIDVILLDSKCYPILDNDSTAGESFWRSTRKVLAASRAVYEKLTGHCTHLSNANVELTGEDSDSSAASDCPPTTKRPCRDTLPASIEEKLDKIMTGVSSVKQLLTLMGNLQQAFQCVVCRGTVSVPVVAKCCGRIVGCRECVTGWKENHATCPHCSSLLVEHFVLRGFDDVATCLQLALEKRDPVHTGPTPPTLPPLSSSDSDTDLPVINI